MVIGLALVVLGMLILFSSGLLIKAEKTTSQAPKSIGGATIVIGTIFALLSSAVVIIPAGQVGVIFNVLSGVRTTSLSDGYHLILPGVETVTLYDARLQEITLSKRGEDGPDIDESISARSKEGLEISADVTVQFRVRREEAAQLHRDFGSDYIRTVIRPQIRSKVRDGIGQFNAADLISTQRSALEKRVTDGLNNEFDKSHLELISVLLRELRIPDSVAKVIEEKQTAEQQVKIEQNRLEQSKIIAQRKVAEAKGESDAAIARAEGESQALRLRGQAIKDNPGIIQLTMVEKLSPSIQTVLLPSNGNFLMGLDGLIKKN
ncbi:MAG: prohibitin family protein [Deinococcaceae bacterium]